MRILLFRDPSVGGTSYQGSWIGWPKFPPKLIVVAMTSLPCVHLPSLSHALVTWMTLACPDEVHDNT